MKNSRRYITMHYLVFVLIISVPILGASCNKTTDYAMEGEFYFVNKTSHNITFSNGFEKYNLSPQASSGAIMTYNISDKEVNESHYNSPLIAEKAYNVPNQPIIIKFDNIKCIVINDEKGENNPLNISSYVAERKDRRKYRFTFTYTEADYARAINCP